MSELRTDVDFVRIYKALRNPKSHPHQYTVRWFGYCSLCSDITEYTGNYGPEWVSTTCIKCNKTFGDGGDFLTTQYNTELKMVPDYARKKIQIMRSRKQQQLFFNEELGSYLRLQKATAKQRRAEARTIEKNIKTLANLRAN